MSCTYDGVPYEQVYEEERTGRPVLGLDMAHAVDSMPPVMAAESMATPSKAFDDFDGSFSPTPLAGPTLGDDSRSRLEILHAILRMTVKL